MKRESVTAKDSTACSKRPAFISLLRASLLALTLVLLISQGRAGYAQDSEPDLSTGTAEPTKQSEGVTVALQQIREGSVDLGIQSLLKMANTGDKDAFFHLGQIYALGAGRTRSVSVAALYYRLAGQLGHKRAELSLANMLLFENDGEAEHEEAADIYRRYALLGEPEALYVLGILYWNGDITGIEDPVRGYGLVWLAAENGYPTASEAELEMNSELSLAARRRARQYALNLAEEGITNDPLAPELIEDDDDAATLAAATSEIELDTLDDWEDVWRVEVGISTSPEAADKLRRVIAQKMGDDLGDLKFRIIQLQNDQGRFKILYGPLPSFQEAVFQCVKFKARGYDCFSRAPR